jgi:hypothetical protein
MPSAIHSIIRRRATRITAQLGRQREQLDEDFSYHLICQLFRNVQVPTDFLTKWREGMMNLDAAQFLLDQFPSRGAADRCRDFTVPKTPRHDDFLDKVEAELARGVVYVSWTRRPEEFLYIGMASGRASRGGAVKRLTDRSHAKLRVSLQQATTLSILIPTREQFLQNLESSCLAFLRRPSGRRTLPVHNDRHERRNMPTGKEAERLIGILRHLDRLPRQLAHLHWGPRETDPSVDDLNPLTPPSPESPG